MLVQDRVEPARDRRRAIVPDHPDGQPAPDVETTINKLNQTGPVGKLITIKLLPEYLGLLADGKLTILADPLFWLLRQVHRFDETRHDGRPADNATNSDHAAHSAAAMDRAPPT